jgi:hypothetical protein
MFVEMTPYGDERTTTVVIDDYDVWNMSDNLALIILPMLKKLQENKQGSPHVDDEDVPNRIKSINASPKEHEHDTDDFFFDRWNYVLDEMIWAFEQIVDENNDSQFHTGGHSFKFEPIEGTELSRFVADPTHRFDSDAYIAHHARITRGTTLFGKYFQALWD